MAIRGQSTQTVCARWRGWLAEEAGTYRVTDAGRAVREDAERLTDQYFYAPWACLPSSEAEEAWERLISLKEML